MKLIRGNEAADAAGNVHRLTWSGFANYAERTRDLTATCSCGNWMSDSGSEANGRRQFTKHINDISRTVEIEDSK